MAQGRDGEHGDGKKHARNFMARGPSMGPGERVGVAAAADGTGLPAPRRRTSARKEFFYLAANVSQCWQCIAA